VFGGGGRRRNFGVILQTGGKKVSEKGRGKEDTGRGGKEGKEGDVGAPKEPSWW